MEPLPPSRCRRCSLPFSFTAKGSESQCIPCGAGQFHVQWIAAWGHYRGSLERTLHAFKFERHDFLADPLSDLLVENLRTLADLAFEAVVPVPMHDAKLRLRGYNQAELLSASAARRIGIRHRPRLLRKRIERASQSTLSRAERSANVRGAFEAGKEAAGLSILLIDDICTTGETLESCARALLSSGAARVCAAVVARA